MAAPERYWVEFTAEDLTSKGLAKITQLLGLFNVDSNKVTAATFEMTLAEYEKMRSIGFKTNTVRVLEPKGKSPHLHPNQMQVQDYIDDAVTR